MLKIVSQNGRNIPRIFCDSCGEAIADARTAAAVFPNFLENGGSAGIMHVHKNFAGDQCMDRAEEKIKAGGGHPGWNELTTNLAYLVANAGLDADVIAGKLALDDF